MTLHTKPAEAASSKPATAQILQFPSIPSYEDIIKAGQKAWAEEKYSKERRLHRWHEIGKALLLGHKPLRNEAGNVDPKAFGAWCRAHGFDDIPSADRSRAVWMAEEWDEIWSTLHCAKQSLSHPRAVKRAYDKAKGDAPDTSKMTSVDAEYIRKLDKLATHPGTPEHEAASAAAKRDELAASESAIITSDG